MKWALALAAIFLLPLSATALSQGRGFVVPGPGGYYGVEETCLGVSVFWGPVSFCLPCDYTALVYLAFVMTALALVIVLAIRRRIERGHS